MTVTADTPTTAGSGLKDGRVVAIAGPVVDVEFPPDALPEINFAVEMDAELEGETITITAEVAQQIGDSRVRAICLKPTDGLQRGTLVRNLGHGITMPVGDGVLGHVFNVIGEPLDIEESQLTNIEDRWEIHRDAPSVRPARAQGADVRDRHQGRRPARALRAGRQDRPLRRCRRGQDRAHPGDDPAGRHPPRWCVGVRRRRRAHP